MESATHIYKANTLADIASIPSKYIDVLTYPPNPLTLKPRLIAELKEFTTALFQEPIDLTSEINSLSRRQLDDLNTLVSEQRSYLFHIRTGESKEDLIRRYHNSYDFEQDSHCNIWYITASLNGQPYGGIFAFQRKGSSDLMIQGISKFLVPNTLAMLRPETARALPKLNSLLIPAIETIGQNIDAVRIIVNPIHAQGGILQKHYGFYPINSKEPVCELIQKSWGDYPWLARTID